jgi:hypothetical protein
MKLKPLFLLASLLGFLSLIQAAETAVTREPAWMAGKPLNEWFAIPGTTGAGGAPATDYSGMTVKESTSEIIIAAAGGHGGSRDNRVVSIDLRADAPKWVTRHAGSPQTPDDVSHNPDGQPASRHSYHTTQYVPQLDRVFLVGCRFTAPASHEFPCLDAFDLATNKWDPKGTHPDIPKGSGYGVVKNTLTGDLYTQTFKMWSPATKTWSSPITKPAPYGVRFPYAFDTKRSQIFGLNFGDGQGYNESEGARATRTPVAGKQTFPVTFVANDAFEQFKKEKPVYAGMLYDPDQDRFLFYSGQGPAAGRIYVVKPSDANVWEMSVFTLGPGNVNPPPAPGSGINNRFQYVPSLKGVVLLNNNNDPLYFLRLAPLNGKK